jgi:hypothetical protein
MSWMLLESWDDLLDRVEAMDAAALARVGAADAAMIAAAQEDQ